MSTATPTAANPVLPLAATEGTRVPFIRLDNAFPELFAELMETVERIASASAFTLGPELERFERSFAEFCGTEHAAGVSSGTAALEIALRALGIGPGDEVIVPTYSFIATAEAVSTVGATPVIVDVEPETALITSEIVERALTPKTRCVIPVHLFGRPVDMDPLLALCRGRGIAVIEDACQAHGALYKGQPVGSLGDAGCFSFYPTKNLGGWGDGGALVTSDAELDHRVRLLRSHGEGTRHHHELATGTHRLDTLQAAILEVKLRHLPDWNQRRRDAAAALRAGLEDTAVVSPLPADHESDHVYHLFVIRCARRDALRDHLDGRGIASAVHYPTPIHLQPAYADLGLGPGSLPVAERLAAENCSLPIFPAIEGGQIDEIVAAVRDFEVPADS
ncbi:MAG TPA: DegT/DnrJ/EryC1/StrS family aminotransferase [Solirubrobacterales bacterium]|nr:DegT/DnrJ/EryC1/StrS family aminotransferase [Solirubrobacterales bacterium]